MTVEPVDVAIAAGGLHTLADNLDLYLTAIFDAEDALEGRLATVEMATQSPRIDTIVAATRQYLTGTIHPAGVAATYASGAIRVWAGIADEFWELLMANQYRRHTVWSRISEPSERKAEEDAAELEWQQLDESWRMLCETRSAELHPSITAIDTASKSPAMALPHVELPAGVGTENPPSAEEVNAWWSTLSPTEQAFMITEYPEIVGNLDGVPAWARDTSNRLYLDTELYRLTGLEERGELSPLDARALENTRAAQAAVDSNETYTDPFGIHPTVQLYIFEPYAFDGEGRTAVSVGDLDTADHTAVLVSGITSDAASIDSGDSQNLYTEARWAAPDESTAVLNWIGYDAPNVDGDAANMGYAHDGAALLSSDVDGLRAMRPGDRTHLTVSGHSYGSTTTAISADDHDLDADDIILLGSPGAGDAKTADDLTTGSDHTWVGSNSSDAVTFFGESGAFYDSVDEVPIIPNPQLHGEPLLQTLSDVGVEQLGVDPSTEPFEAHRFPAESTSRDDQLNIDDHRKYYDPNSESLFNVTAIVVGDYDSVGTADYREHNPDVDWRVETGWFKVPFVDLQVPVVNVDWQQPVDVLPDDPEGDRTPERATHEPDGKLDPLQPLP